ncbi:hypothetical protein GCM10010413_57070 [Promicromonospora sukumoe]
MAACSGCRHPAALCHPFRRYLRRQTRRTQMQETETYSTPVVADLGSVAEVTLGKYAEDSQDEGRYFE